MKRIGVLLWVCVASLPAWALAPEENFDLVGQIRVDRRDAGKVSVVNAVRRGMPPGFGRSGVSLDLAKVSAVLRAEIAGADGKWVGLRGAWVQPHVEKKPDTTWEELGAVVFVPVALTVLDGDYHLAGQIIDYKHPDGSMAGVKYALVDRYGVVSPLEFEKAPPPGEIAPGRRYKAYGRYRRTGHKGLLIAFHVSRLEAIPDERYEADISELGKRLLAAIQSGKIDDLLACWVSVERMKQFAESLPAGVKKLTPEDIARIVEYFDKRDEVIRQWYPKLVTTLKANGADPKDLAFVSASGHVRVRMGIEQTSAVEVFFRTPDGTLVKLRIDDAMKLDGRWHFSDKPFPGITLTKDGKERMVSEGD